MSTRADFYIGRGLQSTWVGSIGQDAFVDNLAPYFEGVSTEEGFRAALAPLFKDYGEISAEHGWPWPWASSEVTGTAIAFDAGQVWVSCHGWNWAPVANWDEPGDQPSVFPDMVADEASTPEGELRIALRRNTKVRLKAGTPVLPSLLTRLAYLVDRMWLHSHEDGARLLMLTPQMPLQDEAFDFARVFQQHGDLVRELVVAQQAADGEPAWGLVTWACEHLRPYWGHECATVALTDELPLYFGQPLRRCPDKRVHIPERLSLHVEPLDEGYRQGRVLLDQVLDRLPFVHAYALAHEMSASGVLPVKADALETWLDEPLPELDGKGWREACSSVPGRLAANKQASFYLW